MLKAIRAHGDPLFPPVCTTPQINPLVVLRQIGVCGVPVEREGALLAFDATLVTFIQGDLG